MKFSAINEYLQTFATLGAIVGLLTVAYEIQQSNRVAESEAIAEVWSQWISTSTALIESDIAVTRAKAMTSPEELTLVEKIDLDLYLQNWIYRYSHNLESITFLDINSEDAKTALLEEITEEVSSVFGSAWSRAWLVENKYWIGPRIFEAIERGLEGVPVGSDLEYYNRIDALAVTIE